jgi:UDP-hydrolysing UDP-N-acetyl-D-glucosamine 2-epimerase
MSHLHFTATEKYRRRVIQMGENPENVFCFGAPGIDNIHKIKLLSKEELSAELGLPYDARIGVVTYHPVTLEKDSAKHQISELLMALKKVANVYWVFTLPNADTEGRVIVKCIEDFIESNPHIGKAFTSLGQLKYLSLLKNSAVMVGNSSSGLIEAPSFKMPVVNVGERQRNRIRAENVIDVDDCKENMISMAISKALSAEFADSFNGLRNPSGEGGTSERRVEKIKSYRLDKGLIKKSFYEV